MLGSATLQRPDSWDLMREVSARRGPCPSPPGSPRPEVGTVFTLENKCGMHA